MTGFTALHVLWLTSAFTFAREEMVRLHVSPRVAAAAGRPAALRCSVSSERPSHLRVQHMEWSRNKTTLCSVNSRGNLSTNAQLAPSDFHCGYEDQQLVLVFNRVRPMESGRYGCKLQSNQGALHQYTVLELEEHSGGAEGYVTRHGPACRFRHVHPDGEVHWFHGSRRLPHDGRHGTTKRVEDGGWLSIDSHLRRNASEEPYNCSLRSAGSGRVIASALVYHTDALLEGDGGHAPSLLRNGGAAAAGAVLYISTSLLFTLQ
ncbi:uncharacterized protein LOC114860743 [Betta splendens]|uniref:Uncharacterized protein LOC114860743 n=1 Tax=Betta splendens TaxID=158456 RepID=A0A6P7NC68_BETSP|nr:uncharacterized protein LOC114860743 [Betta splendens]XP_029015399.1 uncharacterized protein LOC114860743 [Betta splendens]XP_029015409.1 uncharacterized protein LOC114860743 [Betta splendens]